MLPLLKLLTIQIYYFLLKKRINLGLETQSVFSIACNYGLGRMNGWVKVGITCGRGGCIVLYGYKNKVFPSRQTVRNS